MIPDGLLLAPTSGPTGLKVDWIVVSGLSKMLRAKPTSAVSLLRTSRRNVAGTQPMGTFFESGYDSFTAWSFPDRTGRRTRRRSLDPSTCHTVQSQRE